MVHNLIVLANIYHEFRIPSSDQEITCEYWVATKDTACRHPKGPVQFSGAYEPAAARLLRSRHNYGY